MADDTARSAPLLMVRNLKKSFAGIRAVDGLDLEVTDGSITGVIGPNGCGKTTFINCVTGFDRQYTGEVALAGRAIAGLAPEVIARAGMMRTFQAIRVFDNLSVLQNALVGMQSFDTSQWWEPILRTRHLRAIDEKTRQHALVLLKQVGLASKADDPAGNLSYGQKKLLALACTLMSRPRIVILDEPVAGVNPTRINEVAEILLDLNGLGTTFLIIEHNIEFVMKLCANVIVMDRGRRLAAGTPQQIRDDRRVLDAYLGGTMHAEL